MHLFSAASYPPDQHVQYRDYVTILAALTVDEPSHHREMEGKIEMLHSHRRFAHVS